MNRHHVLYPLAIIGGLLFGGMGARLVAKAPSAPVVVSAAPTVAVTADVPPLTAQPPSVAAPSSLATPLTGTATSPATTASAGVATSLTTSIATNPCACLADFARLCPACTAKLDKVASVRTAMADADPANDASAACVASLDYAQSLNDAVIASCAPYWSICSTIAPNPRSGTSEGSNTSEPCFDALRGAVGATVPKGSACDASLQAHDANQSAVKACGHGGKP